MTVSRDEAHLYWYPSEGGLMIAGGDSGGPSFTTVGTNRQTVLVGVHAQTLMFRVPGKENTKGWTWVRSTPQAADAPIKPVWNQIKSIMGGPLPATAPPPTEPYTGRHTSALETTVPFDTTTIPKKPVKTTGRSKVDGTRTPSPPAKFGGNWDTNSSTGGHFELSLSVDGETVTGTFSDLNGNPQYNGTLKGTLNGPMLTYTFAQPAIGAGGSGSGRFMMKSNGKEFYGAFKMDSDPDTNYRWWGNRKEIDVNGQQCVPPQFLRNNGMCGCEEGMRGAKCNEIIVN